MLYNSLVRSRLEYCSAVWSHFYEKYDEIIERVQRKFSRMYSRLKYFQMHSLESRRIENDEITLYKIMHNIIDTSLINSLSYHNQIRPIRQPHQQVYYLPTVSSNIEVNVPMHRIQKNHDFSELNLFTDSSLF